ncbi:molybdate-binding periplasmic protein precursor [bacterium BMS3Abin08]|nr:molybdate-binding periplasmic protein precursor [bacterium BMS3Abin08]
MSPFAFGGSYAEATESLIEAGAPVDVFASASIRYMDGLEGMGLIKEDSRRNFATNSITLIVPPHSGIHIDSFQDLLKNELKRIAIGNPGTVPAGRYAEEILKHFKLWDKLKDRLVFAENVRQVLDYVARGEVDAGMVYASDVRIRPAEVKVVVTAPDESHKPVVYPMAVVKGTKNEVPAREFIALVISDYGKDILKKYGFEPFLRRNKR